MKHAKCLRNTLSVDVRQRHALIAYLQNSPLQRRTRLVLCKAPPESQQGNKTKQGDEQGGQRYVGRVFSASENVHSTDNLQQLDAMLVARNRASVPVTVTTGCALVNAGLSAYHQDGRHGNQEIDVYNSERLQQTGEDNDGVHRPTGPLQKGEGGGGVGGHTREWQSSTGDDKDRTHCTWGVRTRQMINRGQETGHKKQQKGAARHDESVECI